MADQDIQITISTQVDSLTVAMNKAIRKIKDLEDQSKETGRAVDAIGKGSNGIAKVGDDAEKAARGLRSAGAGGHSTVNGVQAASAALRELNGDFLNNIRAVERFITTSPRVAAALKSAFPVVGGVAFAAVMGEAILRVEKFFEVARQMPRQITDAFASVNVAGALANDQLDLTNAKLANEIAKLEHKPQNTLAEALADARVQADQLANSLDTDYNKSKQLLDANRISNLQGIFTFQGATGEAAGTINAYNLKEAELGSEYADAVRSGDKGRAGQLRKSLEDTISSALSKYRGSKGELEGLQGESFFGLHNNESGNIETYRGAILEQQQLRRKLGLNDQNAALEGKRDEDKAAKDLADARRQDATRAAEAAKKAAEDRFRAMEAGATREQAFYGKSIFDTQAYWRQYVDVFRAGSEQYDAVQRKIAEGQDAFLRRDDIWTKGAELAKKNAAEAAKDSAELLRGGDLGQRMIGEQAEDTLHTGPRYTQFRREQYAADAQPGAFAIAGDEASLNRGEAAGTISRQAAAMERAALNARKYAEEIAAVRQQLADLPNQKLDARDEQTQRLGLENQLAGLASSASLGAARDRSVIDDTALQAQWRETLSKFVQASRDSAGQLRGIFTDALGGANNSLVQAATGDYRNNRERMAALRNGLSSTVRGVGSTVANAGLEKIEGSVLGAFGFGGKPDGSANNPLHVVMADAAGAAGAAGGWLAGLLGKGRSDTGPDSGSGFGSLVSGGLGALQGAFAAGGDVVADRPALIGEAGPELFVPRSAGTIVPNSALGGEQHLHYAPTIDARGSTDPAMVEAVVQRQLRQHTPAIIAAANYRAKDHAARRPASAR